MQFKAATREDRGEILSLYRSLVGTEYCAWTETYPGETEVESDLSREALFCMRDRDGTLAGVISIDQDEEIEKLPCWTEALQPSGELSRLGVKEAYQNRGLARELLRCGMEELRRRGCKSVHFLVCKTNRKAIRSYEKLHFQIVGECRLFGEDWWCYEKALAETADRA